MNTLVNICGEARTGSTMFDLILGNDPKAFSLGEVHAWFRPWRTHHFDINCSCGKYPCPKWELVKDIRENSFHKKAFHLLDVNFLIDSSKELSWVIDNNIWAQIHNSYHIHNLLIYKQPVSFALSHWKRKINIKEVLNSYKYYERFLNSNLNFYSISYEEFIRHPDTILKAVCDIINMNYSPMKMNFWEKEHHHLFGSFGTRKQVVKKESKIYIEEFPKEFKKLFPIINKEFNDNPKIKQILKKLAQKDIKISKNISSPIKIKKGHYYYYRKIRAKLKKIFPDQYVDKELYLLNEKRALKE
jgi:hypothetical protein